LFIREVLSCVANLLQISTVYFLCNVSLILLINYFLLLILICIQKVGFELVPVNAIDCDAIASKYQVEIDSHESIPGTHTRFE